MQENKVTVLNDIEHALLRAPMYIGNLNPQEIKRPIIQNDKIVFGEYEYSPALLKLFRELIDNSIDEYLRTSGKYSNKIDIELNENSLMIKDNGRGIPIKPSYDSSGNEIKDSWMPLNAWTNLKAGSNFDDSNTENKTVGQNGVGASLATIFSTHFIGETCDGEKFFKVEAKNNMETVDYKITDKGSKPRGTKVLFFPDLKRFSLETIPSIYMDLLAFDLIFLSITYPDIKFKFNGYQIKINSISALNKAYFNNKLIIKSIQLNDIDGIDIAIGSSEIIPNSHGYEFIHFINGINAYEGGKTLEYLERRLLDPIHEKLSRKYKKIRIQDVKSKMFMIGVFKGINNPRFGNQMKTYCSNTPSQFPQLTGPIMELAKSNFIDKIYKNKEITGPIIDLYKAQQLIEDGKLATKAAKKKVNNPKYWKPSKEYKYFILTEGDSAVGSIIAGVGRDDKGYFPLKGKILNVIKNNMSDILKNGEIIEIANILGIDLSKVIKQEEIKSNLEYENVVIATDADADGTHITALLLTFFYKFAPDFLIEGHVKLLRTPLVIIYNKDDIVDLLFSFEDLAKFEEKAKEEGTENKWSYKYTKGLGSLSELEWEYLYQQYSFEDLLITFKPEDENDFITLEKWMNEDRAYRKEIIKSKINQFEINSI